MPVDFLTEEQQRRYGRYAGEPSPDQLARYFHLDDADHTLCRPRRGDHNRLGFALQLVTVRFLGTFLADPTDVPAGVVAHLRRQLVIADPTCFASRVPGPPGHAPRARVRDPAAVWVPRFPRPAGALPPGPLALRACLAQRRAAWLALRPGHGPSGRAQGVAAGRDASWHGWWPRCATARRAGCGESWPAAPNAAQRARLEALVIVPEGGRQTPVGPTSPRTHRVSGPALVAALDRLAEIRALGVGQLDLPRVPSGRLKALARYAAAALGRRPSRAMPADRRVATLLAFARAFEATAQDDALDLLDLLITDIVAPSPTPRATGAAPHAPRPGCRRPATARGVRGPFRRSVWRSEGPSHGIRARPRAASPGSGGPGRVPRPTAGGQLPQGTRGALWPGTPLSARPVAGGRL